MKLVDFTKTFPDHDTLIKAVVREYGGFDIFKQLAPDVARFGANQGTGGAFIFTKDNLNFHKKHKKRIESLLDDRYDSGWTVDRNDEERLVYLAVQTICMMYVEELGNEAD